MPLLLQQISQGGMDNFPDFYCPVTFSVVVFIFFFLEAQCLRIFWMWESWIVQNMVPILEMKKILNLLVKKKIIDKRNSSFHACFP